MHAHRPISSRHVGPIAALVAMFALTTPVLAQLTTNDWVPTTDGFWTNGPNWTLDPDVPDTNTEVAQFTNVYGANFTVTLDTDVTINGIIYDDTDAVGNDAVLHSDAPRITGSHLRWDRVPSSSRARARRRRRPPLQSPGRRGGRRRDKDRRRRRQPRQYPQRQRDGDRLHGASRGPRQQRRFHRRLRRRRRHSRYPRRRKQFPRHERRRHHDQRHRPAPLPRHDQPDDFESVTINGFYNQGSIKCYASSNITFDGPVTLNTNGVIALEQWFSTREPGRKQDFFFNSAVSDDGNGRGLHFLHGVGTGANGTGTASRTSEFIVGGTSTYGGYTHITANRAPDDAGPFTSTVRLTDGNDRLPTTTTVILGGRRRLRRRSRGSGPALAFVTGEQAWATVAA